MELAELDLNKTYTYADYLTWNFRERVELIKGKIFKMSPAPNRVHQTLSMNISGKLWSHLQGSKCSVFSAPFDVRIARKLQNEQEVMTVVQPDICVVCDVAKLDEHGCVGAPDIVVEILSPSNNVTELKNKYDIYEQAGVKEYWVVSPQNKTFLIYTLDHEKYTPSRLMVTGDTVTSLVLPGFSIILAELFDFE